MGVQLTRCPNCEMDLQKIQSVVDEDELTFCPRCQFPLLLITGKYRLQSVLSRGGSGIVYLARHIHLDRDAERIIKIIRPEIFNIQGMEKRFRREVQITSALSQRNEHIVRIFDDFGEIPELGHFYVMEYLQGEPWSQLFSKNRELPSLPLCIHLILQLCDTMLFAHETGVVHRDLKPDNLMLVPRKHDPYFLKVLDFGIAKPTTNDEFEVTQITQGSLGTPMYMSPEQCLNQPTNARTDIYSMGVLLYELLSGHPPFLPPQGVVSEHTMFVSVLEAQITTAPPSLCEAFPERVHPRLEQIVFRALEKKQQDRYQSVDELREDIEDFISLLPTEDREMIVNLSSVKDSSFTRRAWKKEKEKRQALQQKTKQQQKSATSEQIDELNYNSQKTLALGQYVDIMISDSAKQNNISSLVATIEDMPAVTSAFSESQNENSVVLSEVDIDSEESYQLEKDKLLITDIEENSFSAISNTLILPNKPATVAMFPSEPSELDFQQHQSDDPFLLELNAAFAPSSDEKDESNIARSQKNIPKHDEIIVLEEKILILDKKKTPHRDLTQKISKQESSSLPIKVSRGKEQTKKQVKQTTDSEQSVGTLMTDVILLKQQKKSNKNELLDLVDRIQGPRFGVVNLFIRQTEDWESDPLLAKKLRTNISQIQSASYSSALEKIYKDSQQQIIVECCFFPPAGVVSFLEKANVELRLLPKIENEDSHRLEKTQKIAKTPHPRTTNKKQKVVVHSKNVSSKKTNKTKKRTSTQKVVVQKGHKKETQKVVVQNKGRKKSQKIIHASQSPDHTEHSSLKISRQSQYSQNQEVHSSLKTPQNKKATNNLNQSHSIDTKPIESNHDFYQNSSNSWDDLYDTASTKLTSDKPTMMINIAYALFAIACLGGILGWFEMTKVVPLSTPRLISPSVVSAHHFPKQSHVTVVLRPDRMTFVLIPVRSIRTGVTENFVLFAAKENRKLLIFAPERQSQILQDIEQLPNPDNPSLRYSVPVWAKDVRTLESHPQPRTYTGVLERLQRRKGGPLELVLPDENRNINRIPGLIRSKVQFPIDSMILLVGQQLKPVPKKYVMIFSISLILGFLGFLLLSLARQRIQRSF